MIKVTVELTCNTCGLKYESQTQPVELATEPGLAPAWTAWELIEQAKSEGWLIKGQQVFCSDPDHGHKVLDI